MGEQRTVGMAGGLNKYENGLSRASVGDEVELKHRGKLNPLGLGEVARPATSPPPPYAASQMVFINQVRLKTKQAKSAFRVRLQVINQSLIQRRNIHKMDRGRSACSRYALGTCFDEYCNLDILTEGRKSEIVLEDSKVVSLSRLHVGVSNSQWTSLPVPSIILDSLLTTAKMKYQGNITTKHP
ncbi:unnamed protein product [Spodoptera exigua]|nr:unnamed protein product [Spodoptera exigua]